MSRGERVLLHVSVLVAAATGVALVWMKHVLTPRDPFSVVGHPWQPQVLAAHVVGTPLLVFALGLIARGHILDRLGDRSRNGAGRSGLAATLLALPMVVTGYVLQIATGTQARRLLAGFHWSLGLMFTLLYALHLVVSWPATRRRQGRTGSRSRRRPARGPAGGRDGRLDPARTPGLQSTSGTLRAEPAARSDGRRP